MTDESQSFARHDFSVEDKRASEPYKRYNKDGLNEDARPVDVHTTPQHVLKKNVNLQGATTSQKQPAAFQNSFIAESMNAANAVADSSYKSKKKRLIYATDAKGNGKVYNRLPSDSAGAYKNVAHADYIANDRRQQLFLEESASFKTNKRTDNPTQKATIEIDDSHLVRRDHPRKSLSYAKAKGNTVLISG